MFGRGYFLCMQCWLFSIYDILDCDQIILFWTHNGLPEGLEFATCIHFEGPINVSSVQHRSCRKVAVLRPVAVNKTSKEDSIAEVETKTNAGLFSNAFGTCGHSYNKKKCLRTHSKVGFYLFYTALGANLFKYGRKRWALISFQNYIPHTMLTGIFVSKKTFNVTKSKYKYNA